MAQAGKHPWLMIVCLLVFFAFAATMFAIGGRMALFRSAERDLAQPAMATILNVDRKTSTDSDGRSTTYYSFIVEMNLDGEIIERPLVAANFEPDDIWFNSDQVDLGLYQADGRVEVLTRPDLGFRTTPADWSAAYLVSMILMGFGGFMLAFLSLWSWLAFR
ncbi:MAG: hypothetical protein AAF557_18665 [Pseudomonadota bacterium]